MKKKTTEERFWEKVDQSGSERYPDCWLWTASTQGNGYGYLRINKKAWYAHRFSWTLHNGKIPDDLCVLHIKCDNPPCVNPDHLKLGTNADNTADMIKKRRNAQANKTSYIHDHLYDEINTYFRTNGNRDCRACHRNRGKRYNDQTRKGPFKPRPARRKATI